MNDLLCVTCSKSLRDYGRLKTGTQFAYCSICEAVYQVVPIIEEDGQLRRTPYGDVAFYLNPVKPGKAKFQTDLEDQPQKTTDLSDLLDKIQKAKSPKDLLE